MSCSQLAFGESLQLLEHEVAQLWRLCRLDCYREDQGSRINLVLFLERINSLVLQFRKVGLQPLQLVSISHVVGLALQELDALVGERKCGEQECFDWMGKEPVLSFLGVLVHYIAHNSKVNGATFSTLSCLGDEDVSLAISVREHDHHHGIDHCHHFMVSEASLLLEI